MPRSRQRKKSRRRFANSGGVLSFQYDTAIGKKVVGDRSENIGDTRGSPADAEDRALQARAARFFSRVRRGRCCNRWWVSRLPGFPCDFFSRDSGAHQASGSRSSRGSNRKLDRELRRLGNQAWPEMSVHLDSCCNYGSINFLRCKHGESFTDRTLAATSTKIPNKRIPSKSSNSSSSSQPASLPFLAENDGAFRPGRCLYVSLEIAKGVLVAR